MQEPAIIQEPNRAPRPKNTYWVEAGVLLAGEYPGSPSPLKTRIKLEQYLDSGIRAFMDLTHPYELAPYAPTLADLANERSISVEYKRMSIDDMGVPNTLDWMRAIQDQLLQWREQRTPAYVHCWGGVGRTGTVIACQLIEQRMSPQAALLRLDTLWKGMSKEKRRRYPHSPQTAQQVQFVTEWKPR